MAAGSGQPPPYDRNDFIARPDLHNKPLPRTPTDQEPPAVAGLANFKNLRVQEVSSSEDDRLPEPSSRSRPSPHSRSMSHPFPSLFSPKRKDKNGGPPFQHSPERDASDDYHKTKTSAPMKEPASSKAPSRGPVDFTTGNCMTCGGLVRWPKELHVFRCTICLTINDLKPFVPEQEQHGRRQPNSDANLGPEAPHGHRRRVSQPPIFISLDRTRGLIKQCLRAMLSAHLSVDAGRPNPSEIAGAIPRTSTHPGGLHHPETTQSGWDSSTHAAVTPPVYVSHAVSDEPNGNYFETNPLNLGVRTGRSLSASYPEGEGAPGASRRRPSNAARDIGNVEPKRVFKPLEEYLITCFTTSKTINGSFVARRLSVSASQPPDIKRLGVPARKPVPHNPSISVSDPRLLFAGDRAENVQPRTGGHDDHLTAQQSARRGEDPSASLVNVRSPRIDWGEVMEWYHAIINAAEPWHDVYMELSSMQAVRILSEAEKQRLEVGILAAQDHLQRVLLKCTETLLKRPGRPVKEPQDIRFLLLILANPLLHPRSDSFPGAFQNAHKGKGIPGQTEPASSKQVPGRHSGIIKRILGILSQAPEQCHQHLVAWFSRLSEHLFLQTKDLIGSFVTYRLSRQTDRKVDAEVDITAGLIPEMPSGRNTNVAASLHAAIESSQGSKRSKQVAVNKAVPYSDDWQIKAAARVMALLFTANNLTKVRRTDAATGQTRGHLLATSDFYNTLLDCSDFTADFELWESRRGKFAFCQYPFFLSIWAKIQILEFDAKRQMAGKAREAFFDSILTHRNYTQFLTIKVRRECLVEDSLKKVSEVVGNGSEDIKKGLRIEFNGEEGVDAGGLRKEWFLLLVREVFNPDHGLFIYDEDSQYCYFNPNTFETSDQYFLVGVLLGLAIYNSTILDIALPPFAFRKLLAAAPPPSAGSSVHPRPTMTYSLDELAEYRPSLAHGLHQLLEFEGDVESVFALDFVVNVDKYGSSVQVPLCPGGATKPVTNANRREYVDLYVRYLLDTAVNRQFEPFKRGFFTVCAGNALSLFRPEEIELLIRGSDEPLDIASLKVVADYTNWDKRRRPEDEPVVQWFWQTFQRAEPKDQRKLLSFITGSDRIPAMGAASLVIRINCLGDDEGRYPTARTCFNMLSLYRYGTPMRLEKLLWEAVNGSEGFGLK